MANIGFGYRKTDYNVRCYYRDGKWGEIENANKLIRQYIPKNTNIWSSNDSFVSDIQTKLNRRPREKLNFSSPLREFFKHFN